MHVRQQKLRSVMIVALVAVGACQAAPRQRPIELGPVDTGLGTLTAARKYLEGRWTLESFQVFPPGGAPLTLAGQGTLSYDAYGNLAMEIRADEQSSSLLRAAGIDVKGGTVATTGRTVVDMQNRTLTYVVEGSSSASNGPLSLSRPRHWQVDGNRLTLTTRDDNGNPLSIGQWRKMP